ncbi:MAG: diguanylate cyclase [Deltaproteobacteria bacterium]|nr:diguanylate cyclase [Deltaproteobacteria bacterium]
MTKANNVKDSAPITLSEYIDLSIWNEFQNNLSNLSDISLAICSSDGSLLAPPSREDSICKLIKKETVNGREFYRESYKKAIAKAVLRAEPYVYKCYTNQYIFVIPVILNNQISVAIIGGHVYLSEDDFKEFTKKAAGFGLNEVTIHEIEKRLKIVQPNHFFTKPNIIKEIGVPFLRSLYLKSFYEKKYYHMQNVIDVTTPGLLKEGQENIYQHIFNAMTVLFNVDTACIMERHGKGIYRAVAAFGHKKSAISDWTVSDSLDIINKILSSKRHANCSNMLDIQNMGLPQGITSVDIFPMATGNNIFGLLSIFNTKLTIDSVKLLALLANQLSFVSEEMMADQYIKKKIKTFDAMEEVYKAIAPMLEQEELHNAILNQATELVGAEQGSLMLLDNEDKDWSIKASKGIDINILENIKVKTGEGISGTVIEKGVPVIVRDIESEFASLARKNRARYKTKSFVSMPLKVGSRTIGIINISDKITGEVFAEEDLKLLTSFSSYASIALECGTYYRMAEDLKKISVTDPLTELFNRRYFQERLFEEIERSKRHNESFTLFMLDIDDFKLFNDKYGHLAGDEVLKKIAYAIKDAIRSIDVASRFGGEEFSIILPYTNKANSYVIAERIRRNVEDIRFIGSNVPAGHLLSVSVSIGIAEAPSDAVSIEELLDKADKAMYLAKAGGKNKIVSYGQ